MSTAMTAKHAASVPAESRTPAQVVRDKMLSAADRVQAAIGSTADARRCLTIAAMAIENNPALIECGQTPGGIKSLVGGVAKAALFGLYCDGVTGDAYLVPFGTNVAPRGEAKRYEKRAQLIIGYKGLRKLVARAGECEVVGETVHEGDDFRYLGPFEKPHHIRSNDPNRRQKKLTHVYILAQFPRSNSYKCFSWSREECIAHRDAYSEGWKMAKKWADKDKRPVDPDSSPWHEDNPAFSSMCLKTIIRFAINRGELPMSIEDRNRGADTIVQAEELPASVEAIDADDFSLVAGHIETDPIATQVAQDIAAGGAVDQSVQTAADPLAAFRASVSHIRVIPNLAAKLAQFVHQNPTLKAAAEDIAQQREVELMNPA